MLTSKHIFLIFFLTQGDSGGPLVSKEKKPSQGREIFINFFFFSHFSSYSFVHGRMRRIVGLLGKNKKG